MRFGSTSRHESKSTTGRIAFPRSGRKYSYCLHSPCPCPGPSSVAVIAWSSRASVAPQPHVEQRAFASVNEDQQRLLRSFAFAAKVEAVETRSFVWDVDRFDRRIEPQQRLQPAVTQRFPLGCSCA